jgi:hypothetical protein
LIAIAEISAALIGLFLVGMIFYIQTGFDRLERSRDVVEPYFRAATLITFISFAIPLGISLTLVALPIVWSRLLYVVLVVGLIVVDFSTVKTVLECVRMTGLRLLAMMEVVGTAVVALMVILPVATGGLRPDREDFVPALLLSLGIGFLSTCVLVLTLFDIARFERSGKRLGESDDGRSKTDPESASPDAVEATNPDSENDESSQ